MLKNNSEHRTQQSFLFSTIVATNGILVSLFLTKKKYIFVTNTNMIIIGKQNYNRIINTVLLLFQFLNKNNEEIIINTVKRIC